MLEGVENRERASPASILSGCNVSFAYMCTILDNKGCRGTPGTFKRCSNRFFGRVYNRGVRTCSNFFWSCDAVLSVSRVFFERCVQCFGAALGHGATPLGSRVGNVVLYT